MSSQMGLVLSLVFFIQAMLFSVDLLTFQSLISKLELAATTTKSLVARDGSFDSSIEYLKKSINGELVCKENCEVWVSGSLVTYSVTINYKPIFMSFGQEERKVSVSRSVMIR